MLENILIGFALVPATAIVFGVVRGCYLGWQDVKLEKAIKDIEKVPTL